MPLPRPLAIRCVARCCLVLASAGCSDPLRVVSTSPPEALTEDTGAPATLGPVYALHTMVYGLDDSVTSYVTLTDTLDLAGVPRAAAREFPGYAFISAADGKLLVSSGDAPTITRFDIGADLDWQELDTLSFANQGITGSGAGFERHWFLDADTAYVTLDVTQRVVWSPTQMLVRGVMEDSALQLERDGLQLDASFNRQPRPLRGPVLKAFYYRDSDWFRFGPSSPIAVYDPETHAERAILEVPCPGLEVASQDERGNTYFSSWTYGPSLSLYGEGPAPCVRRITPDSRLDEAWAPDLQSWTGGRPVQVFRYARDGKALGTVLHSDEVGSDFSAGYDPDAAAELDSHYRLWLFDLDAETARPIDDIGATGSGFLWANFDGRTFVFAPNEDWSRSTVYEVGLDGTASPRFESVGFVNEWIRVR